MSEKRITIRLNMDKYSHRLAYEIYRSIPSSQRSDYIRLAIILMHDRDEMAKRIREILLQSKRLPDIGASDAPLEDTPPDMSEAARNMLGFISRLNTQ
jgi:hypothetical protein